MTTLQGALVRVEGANPLVELAERYRLAVTDASGPWLLIEDEPRLGRLGPPAFAQELSRELNSSVIAFFLQTNVANERIEHWERGELVRELEYHLDGGGWIAQRGAPQSWESAYFFAEDEGVAEGERWPRNLLDDISGDGIDRYRQARSAKDPSSIMDLLAGGSIAELCKFFGVDLAQPEARHTAARSWRPTLLVALLVVVLAGGFILGATTGR